MSRVKNALRMGLAVSLSLGASGMLLAGCSATQTTPAPPPASSTTTATSPSPALTRNLPPEQRQNLAALRPEQVCALLAPNDLRRLAFAVEAGEPRQTGDIRGCGFKARNGARSVILGVQPPGMEQVGVKSVPLQVPTTMTQHANDCSVMTRVPDATLQVTVVAGEADSDECQTAETVTQYLLGGLVL